MNYARWNFEIGRNQLHLANRENEYTTEVSWL